ARIWTIWRAWASIGTLPAQASWRISMERPTISGAPGLVWRRRASGAWVAYWVARRDFVKAGYRPETSRITSITGQLTDEDVMLIRDECVRMQSDMQAWALRLTPPRDGTVRSLLDE